jgi:hypothetical protein
MAARAGLGEKDDGAEGRGRSRRGGTGRSSVGRLGRWTGGGTPSKAKAGFWTGGTIPWDPDLLPPPEEVAAEILESL